MKIYLFLFQIVLLVLSCQTNNDKENNQIRTFNLEELPKLTKVTLSDLGVSEVEYIPLETTDMSLIPDVKEIILNRGRYNILTHMNYILIKYWSSIFLFQCDGSFVTKIGIQGNGPEEFQVAHSVDFDKYNNIYLISGWQKKVNIYSEEGKYLKTFKIPLHAALDFRFVDGNLLCYSDNTQGMIDSSFILIDSIGTVIKSYHNKFQFSNNHNGGFSFIHENIFYRFNNVLYKKEVYSDTIYCFKNLNFIPHIVINFGERTISPEARATYEASYIAENFVQPLNLFEFGDYVYYSFINKIIHQESQKLGFIGSKKDNLQILFDLDEGIINDLDGGLNIIPITIKDNYTIITLLDALELKNHVASNAFRNSNPKYPEKKKALEKLAASLKETDNPVLVLVRLKK